MKKIISLLLFSLLTLTACVKDSQSTEMKGDYKVEFLFEHNGCKVYRFMDGRYVYYTDCGCGNVTTSTTHKEGKSEVLDQVNNKNN